MIDRNLLSPVQVMAVSKVLTDGASHRGLAQDKSSASTSRSQYRAVVTKRRPDRYRIELKGWIPHRRVVDPDVLQRPEAYLDRATRILNSRVLSGLRLLSFAKVDIDFKYVSVFRGDNHRRYNGSFRVRAVISFLFDGRQIRGARKSGRYGVTHRDWSAYARVRLYVDTPLGDIHIKTIKKSKKGVQRGQATRRTSGSIVGEKGFRLGIRTRNPLLMSTTRLVAPSIDAAIGGRFRSRRVLAIRYTVNRFPSWGLRVIKNGKTKLRRLLYDASRVPVRGLRGAVGLFRLMISKHSGSVVLRL